MNKINISIRGMHCKSCEMLVEDALLKVPHVKKATISSKKGKAEIFYANKKPDFGEIEEAVRGAGYNIGTDERKKSFFSKNANDYKDLGIAFLFLVGIYVVLKNFGFAGINIGSASNPSGLPVVFLVGLTAGLSTCMALVGGLILGISARHAKLHPEATPMEKFRPHLFFNVGRIASYTILGGALGASGSLFHLSGNVLGILTIIVGLVMLLLGMKLTGIFPKLENIGVALPKSVSKFFGIKKHHEREYSHWGSVMSGALTFFLPCGFTQAMQLYAISSGNFSEGALIMGLFALGTAPGLLGIGGFTSLVKGIFAQRFFKFAGILVVFLAFFNIANGYNLTGWQFFSDSQKASINKKISDPNVKMENGVQVVRMTENSRGYSPNSFTITKGIPVRWIIDAKDPYSCASSLMVQKLNIRKSLKAGENIIEFTPKETGKIPFSCSMGMYTGVFNVADENGSVPVVGNSDSQVSAPSGTCATQGSQKGGCGGCSSKKPVTPKEGVVQTSENEQVIKTTYTSNDDIQPNVFTVKSSVPVRFEIDVKEDGYGCMSTIMIPGLDDNPQLLEKGSKIVMTFIPKEKGSFNITCAMGVPRGVIRVQ